MTFLPHLPIRSLILLLFFSSSKDQTENKDQIGGTKGTRRLLLIVIPVAVYNVIPIFSHQDQIVIEAESWNAILSH